MFTSRNRWKRTEELEEDQWFIPYKRRSALQPLEIPQGGIGEMPTVPPTSTSVNMSRPTRSFFGSGSGGHGSGSGSRARSGSGSSQNQHQRMRSTDDEPTARPRFFARRPQIQRSGSDGSFNRPSPFTVPSTTSVPTGLAAPKMLFSPMMRELRDGSDAPHHSHPAPSHRAPLHGNNPPTAYPEPRQRTVSLPKSQPNPTHVYDKVDRTRWAAPTMCDMLVFPRPHITPHTITPPQSPEKLPSVFDGLSVADKVDRDKERDEWHQFVEKRARGRSFRIGGSGNGDGDGEKGGIFRSRARSASAGAGPSRKSSRAKSEKTKRELQDPNFAPPLTTSFFGKTPRSSRDTQPHDDLEDDPFRHRPTEAERYKARHHHQNSKSSPDLSANHRLRVRMAPPPPPPWMDDGVIVIGASKSRSGLSKSSTKPDFTKPLPPLPAEYRLQYNPSSPFKPFGPAKEDRTPSPAQLPPGKDPVVLSDPVPSATATAAAAGPSSLSQEPSPADARAMIARQHQRAMTKRAFNSPRPRQHRDSEVSNSTTSQYSQGSHRTSTLSAVSPLRRMTAMEEAIGRSRANSAGSRMAALHSSTATRVSAATTALNTQASTSRTESRLEPASGQTTPRMGQVSANSQTPSPRNQNHEDFKVCLYISSREMLTCRACSLGHPRKHRSCDFSPVRGRCLYNTLKSQMDSDSIWRMIVVNPPVMIPPSRSRRLRMATKGVSWGMGTKQL
jgi:hypothetical protein